MREVRGRASLGPCGYLKVLQMCVKLENHLDLLTSQPQLLPLCLLPPASCGPS